MNNEDKIYIEWYNTITEIDFSNNEYRKEILSDFTDDLTLLMTTLLANDITDEEYVNFVEDALDTIYKFGCVFLIQFEKYEQYEDAYLLHTILLEMLTLIYVAFNYLEGDYNDCNQYAKEQLSIAIDIIKHARFETTD